MIDNPTFYLAGVLALGVAAQWLAWRLRVPAIVLLLAFGFALRYFVGPPQLFIPEQLLFPFVSLAVGVILFEGGLSLRFAEIRSTTGVVVRLVTLGLFVSWVLTGFAAYWILGFSPEVAALLGALLTVSGPTVIIPLLRHVRLSKRIGSVAKWEGIVNDPIGAVLAALVFQVILLGDGGSSSQWLIVLGQTLLVGLTLGGAGAIVIIQLLRRYAIPDYLQSPVVLVLVIVLFAVSNELQRESGLVTATLLGVILANQRTVTLKHVIEFKENLRVLLIATLFIVLASNVEADVAELAPIAGPAIAFIAFLLLVVRPLAVLVSTLGSELSWNERWLLAWIHPRGIVAAAVASLLALELSHTRFGEEGDRFVLAVFVVIVASVAAYGLLLAPLARRLRLSTPNPQGILFAGASPVVRTIADAVQNEGITVLLVDTNHQNISAARMAGLPVCFASIGSEFVQDEIDFGDIGRMLAMTPNDEVNTLAAMEFAERFGRAETYQLATVEPSSQRRDRVAAYRRGRTLFRKDATFEVLASRSAGGAAIKKTLLTEDFTFDDFRARYGATAIVLFIVDELGRLIVNTTEGPKSLKAGQKVVALVDPVERPATATDSAHS